MSSETAEFESIEALAAALLIVSLASLNHPNSTNWHDIVPIINDIFEDLEPDNKDDLVHQLCIQLNIVVDYDKNKLMLRRFFADIDHN